MRSNRFQSASIAIAMLELQRLHRQDLGANVVVTLSGAHRQIVQGRVFARIAFQRRQPFFLGRIPVPLFGQYSSFADFAAAGAYADVDRYFADLVAVFAQEIADLVGAGCRYLQLDEIAVALLCDPAIRDRVEAAGGDPGALVDRYIDAINGAIAACPDDVVVGVHLCRGNFKGSYLAAGGYESVAERLFTHTRANHFLLEYDTPRAGDFAPLRFVPRGKGVVLGLVSSKTPALENLDALRRRTDEAARHIDLDRLAISPQCGFASSAAGNPLGEADQRAKLRLVVEAARAIWG